MANEVLLQRIELAANTSSVIFNNLPTSGFTHLKLRISGRSTLSATRDYGSIKLNGDSNNPTYQRVIGYSNTGVTADGAADGNAGFAIPGASSTGTQFGATDINFYNFLGTTSKTVTTEFSSPNNAVDGMLGFYVLNYASVTAPLTSIEIISTTFVTGSTFSLYGITTLSDLPSLTTIPKASGGDKVVTDGKYWYHTFLNTGVFSPAKPLKVDTFILAGGGGGGRTGGGGGAGGLLYTTQVKVFPSYEYVAQVGSGGAGTNIDYSTGRNGTNSTFIGAEVSLIAYGGGGGAGYGTNGATGGSGGGAGVIDAGSATSGGSPTSGQGYAGGNGVVNSGTSRRGGGGGGAGEAGMNAGSSYNTGYGGNGGSGSSSYGEFGLVTGTGYLSSYFAIPIYGGGGGGSGYSAGGSGGDGGGGYGGNNSSNSAANGTVNTGSGGGSGYNTSGANGGSGLIVVRYEV